MTSIPPELPPRYQHLQYRPAANVHAPSFGSASQREDSARAFDTGAQAYDDARPGYPALVLDLLGSAARILDIGAGTGKLTALLAAQYPEARVWALDPSPDMCAHLRRHVGVPVWRATAEATALADAAVDAVTCAQAWHWVDTAAACAELDRIVAPGGRVVLVWNTIDVKAQPWVLRLARIMHSGDVMAEGFYPTVAAPWVVTDELRLRWEDPITPAGLHRLMHTRAYWLRNGEKIHQRMTENLNWYLHEHLGFAPDEQLALPYRTDAFVLERA